MTDHYVVLGGAGFIGSHLVEELVSQGERVTVIDNLLTGWAGNLDPVMDRITFRIADVTHVSWLGLIDATPTHILHLASPASPVAYAEHPLQTMRANADGTRYAALLAAECGARLVFASTSEVYGSPAVHPQVEEYWGNVNPVGPRSMYDESKRYAEALLTVAQRAGTNAGIVRIFNTYGPRMDPQDGRVIPTFMQQALAGEPLTVFGSGQQTRSLCYVSDLVRGLLAMARSTEPGPINLGNPQEVTVLDLARRILVLAGRAPDLVRFAPLPQDDPERRCPHITRARLLLDWSPEVDLDDGLLATWCSYAPAMP